MPYRSDVRNITRALNWIGGGALVAGIAVVVWSLWWTRGVEDFRTAVIIAAMGFGLPSIVALAVAWLLDPLTDSTVPAAERIFSAEVGPAPAQRRRIDARYWPPVLQYLIATGVVVAAAGARVAMDPILGTRVPFITFFLAVALAAWFGGFGASALATALSIFIAWHWFMRGSTDLPPDLHANVVAAGVFAATALAIGGLTAAMRATAAAADRLSAEARLRNVELQRSETELRGQRDRLVDNARIHTMVDDAPVLTWATDASGARIQFNRQWLEFTGRTLDQALGLQWADAIHANDRDACLHALNEALAARLPFRVYYRLCRFDGEYRSVVEEGMPCFAADGAFIGYAGACMDVDAGASERGESGGSLPDLRAVARPTGERGR
jgi:PAS domain S-box-containing protein